MRPSLLLAALLLILAALPPRAFGSRPVKPGNPGRDPDQPLQHLGGGRQLQEDVQSGGSSSSGDTPSTAAVVAGVVGGLAGLTLVLAGALLVASGVIHRWHWCAGWALLGPAETLEAKSTSPKSSLLTAGGGVSSRNYSLREADTWGLLPGAGAPGAALTHAGLGSAPGSPRAAGGPAAAAAAIALAAGTGEAEAGPGLGLAVTAPPMARTSNGSTSTPSPLSPLAADLGWRDCLLDPAKVQILRRPNGAPWRLGGGSFGQVYKALYDDVQVVAVKVLSGMSDPAALEAVLREGRILRDCRDRNVVQFVGAAFDPESDQAMLVTEYMEAGDLWRALRWRDEQGRRVFGWCRRGRRAALDAARGLHHLHSRHVLHLDLKSANILLARDGTAKVADVGLAKVATKGFLTAVNTMGTFAYCAPEVLTGQKADLKADIFAFGVVLWEIVTGESPTRGGMRDIEVPAECPAEIRDLCDRCMSADPKKRPTAKELVVVLERHTRGGGVDRTRTLSAGPLPPLATQPVSPAAGPDSGMRLFLGGRDGSQQPGSPASQQQPEQQQAGSQLEGGAVREEEEEEAENVGGEAAEGAAGPPLSLRSWSDAATAGAAGIAGAAQLAGAGSRPTTGAAAAAAEAPQLQLAVRTPGGQQAHAAGVAASEEWGEDGEAEPDWQAGGSSRASGRPRVMNVPSIKMTSPFSGWSPGSMVLEI